MAYGDTTEQYESIPWEEFEYTEYLERLDDLLGERNRAFAIAHGDPDDPREEWASTIWLRCNRAIEETALEFVVYVARCRVGDGWWDG